MDVDNNELDKNDWVYCMVYLNHFSLKEKFFTSARIEDLIIHEMMHVYGAKHSSNINSIMYPVAQLRKVKGLTADANQLLRNKYS